MKKKNLFLLALVNVLSLGGCSFFNLLPESSTKPSTESDTSVESTSSDESSSESSSSTSGETSESSTSEETSSTSDGPVVLVEEIKIYDGTDPSHPLQVAVSTYVGLEVNVVVLPSNATDKSLSWKADDPTVAGVSVYQSSEWVDVFGLKLGTTKITFTANDGSGVSADIYVETYEVPITGLKLKESGTFEEKYEVNLNVGDTYSFYADVTPYATPNHETYARELTSSEKQYISLTKDQYDNYEVTALKAGEVTIRIYSEANNTIYKDLVVTIV